MFIVSTICFSNSFLNSLFLRGEKGYLEKLTALVDTYFDFTGRHIIVIKESSVQGGVFCITGSRTVTLQEKLLKAVSYLLLVPVIILLIFKCLLHLLVYLKYRSFYQVNENDFREIMMFRNEEYNLPALPFKVYTRLEQRHQELRSGISRDELEKRGFYFFGMLDSIPYDNIFTSDLIITFGLLEFPGYIFQSLPSTFHLSEWMSKERGGHAYVEAIRILEGSNIMNHRSILRCRYDYMFSNGKRGESVYDLVIQQQFHW
ncbi:DUF648 domain-containing protein [Candidatus Chlamydia sanziniae]|uniref:Uncharacterized protein n=1 Tax=Candidatus Chlamydia sanziniae TaxID=1806891 RepID=A0A1A9HY09_9CHLA|nr:DUF648 domain-containing protein [Candidatus Chlamydia sanziniae]ANH78972.1 hypothetical protein Cs308_0802 [Candidatus Chlamydia sanziniae]